MHNSKFALFAVATLLSNICLNYTLEIDFKIEERAKNVAVLQTSAQSSIADTLNPSSLAIDDNRDTCSKTGSEKEVTWSVILEKKYPIAAILIKTDPFFGPNHEISIGDDQTTRGSLCNYGSQEETIKDHIITCLTGPMLGRVVTIKNLFVGGLRLCDVRVMVCEDGYFGALCMHTCQCHEGKPCNKISGECPGFCAPGWMGNDCQRECQEGHFGPSCRSTCHCQIGSNCSSLDGSCQTGCEEDWIGPSCQTGIPKLSEAPILLEAHISEVTISWTPWDSYIDESISPFYVVEYKPSSHLGNDSSGWTLGATVEHTELGEVASTTISGLKKNTFYEFRVVPMLKMPEHTSDIRGGASPGSVPFKTECNAPTPPNITSLHSWSGGQGASITIQWTLLSKKQSNCDNIKYYEILYQKLGETTWQTEYSNHTVSSKNITGLEYDSDYWFIVVAHNNQPLDSSSARKSFTTVAEVRALQSLEKPTTDIGVVIGATFCSILIVALAFILFFYRRQMKKYNSIPQQELEGKIEGGLRSINDTYQNHPSTGNFNPSASPNDLDEPTFEYGDDVAFAPDPPFRHSKHFLYENGRIAGKPREIPTPTVPPERQPIAVKDLEGYIIKGKDNDCQLFRKEFKDIPDSNLEASSASGAKTENRYKNRFINILPYDHSRVVLEKNGNTDCSDYINASYIDGYKKPKAYIASQGCNKWTLQDMWRMVWQVDTRRIVMVTNLIEKGKVKCEQYWSDKEHDETFYGNIGVTLLDVERTTDYIIRTFSIRLREFDGDCPKEALASRIIKQFHYVAWPDHGVPDRAGPIIAFRRKVRLHDVSHPGVILIHCSAGVGRTGAFIAIDYLLDAVQAEESIDVYNYACSMRRDRVNMIQTLDQYVFVYDALLEALKIGDTIISSASFSTKFQSLLLPDENGVSSLEKEYQLLDSVSYKGKPEDYVLGSVPENIEKNRFPDILPADKHRPFLMTRVQGTNDYINAVYLDGYRSRNAYISTQMPMTHTVIDLWRLVHELQCGTVVMLNSWDEHDDTYGQYWSEENEECECGPFMIEASAINRDNPDVTVRELKLTFTPPPVQPSPIPKNNNDAGDKPDNNNSSPSQQKQQLTVNHFQLNISWPDTLKETNVSTTSLKVALISLLDMVEKSQMKTGNKSIVVHCRDGVAHSGLFVAISCIIERLKDEQEVEVFQTVRKLRDRRPNVIKDFNQYKFCYEMVLAYLTEFSIYSNFK